MSHNNSVSGSFSDRNKLGFTKSAFVLFALLFIIASVVFFLILDHGQLMKSEKLIERSALRTEILELKNRIGNEAQNSLNKSLLFNISSKEIDRIQTIYSLKATKNLYDELVNSSVEYSHGLSGDFQSLNQLLSDYDRQIAESINKDGRLIEIINGGLQSSDTTGGDFLFDKEDVGLEISEAKALESIFEDIQFQLFIIENHISTLIISEIDAISSDSPVMLYVVFSMILVLLLVILGYLLVRNFHSSVADLSKTLDYIAMGERPEEDIRSEGEFARIAEAGNQLVNYLEDASQFAIKIGDGDFGYEFKSKSKDDALGNSLLDMRNRLQEVALEDKIRNWVNEGQAKFGEILRQHSDDVESLAEHIIIGLVEYLKASQGALFVLIEKRDESYLELLSAYAYKRKKHIQKKIEIGEGLAGQAFEEGKTIYMTDIKTNHYDIRSGLGASKPSSLLILPLKEKNRVEGIIEIASLKELEKYQIEFVESIGESIASSLNAGKVNQSTKKLLEETQEKAEEMRAQEEELRQNMEEMEGIQQQLLSTEFELARQKDLLENLSEFHPAGIVVLDQSGQVNFATKNILSKLNKEDVEGMDFKDIFDDKVFGEFLTDIDFNNTKDTGMEIALTLKEKSKEKLNLLAISASKENEDGAQNIFLIQK